MGNWSAEFCHGITSCQRKRSALQGRAAQRPSRYRHLHVRHRAHEVAGLGTAMTAHCTQVLDGRLGMITTSLDLT
jgi:hypothetical protein